MGFVDGEWKQFKITCALLLVSFSANMSLLPHDFGTGVCISPVILT
jgi:hypothetical protein